LKREVVTKCLGEQTEILVYFTTDINYLVEIVKVFESLTVNLASEMIRKKSTFQMPGLTILP